ncbi:hypothetical protein GFL91_23085 [Rhizobium leguminosarum bv. viciae]|uniref:Uncharacterized protein n=1 Tax=Rhizobium leguminosarum bv. viciae TaxID=387 RepID=A0A8I2H1G1_RHILV|nr:DUF6065 family protein [Rhizobium leguminosarum]ASR11965.1 hypothetical protein CHY08_33475 [Rhizobium leguminosarum bv. viciae]MBY5781639.1 hypothetical protein [Rhizobium leguminosarum]MBY5793718.1 hypothetical protein [Rhizobium leguminosarum]MBY5800980.1 hypothetical protein [Rhizobium leguminosarum]MBY5826086.1 hypothetical protein [Rhizobium leguminosarum]
MTMAFLNKPQLRLTFLCRKEDEGVIPAPVRAKTALPDWFRRLPAVDEAHVSSNNSGLTVKRCMPFLDAMATGWVIGLAASVRMEIADDGKTVDCGWDFDRTLVSNHASHQVAGNPREPLPPCKFHNYWTIRTPPGWSCLFVPPLNRPNGVFEVVAGVVDTDTYQSEIHFPFFATGEDGLHVLERGTPIVQVIPFRRDASDLDADIRTENPEEGTIRKTILRKTLASDGWYRRFARAQR